MHNGRLFIFGTGGFIGGYFKDKFSVDEFAEVVGYSSRDCNLLSSQDIEKSLSQATRDDAVVITAAITRTKDNSCDSMVKNIQMIDNFCRVVSQKPVKQIVFLSTIDVYGVDIDEDARIDESFLPCPNDYYAVSKIAAEYLLKQVCSQKSISLTILRLPGIYGPGDNFRSTVGVLVKNVIDKGAVTIYGDGSDLRDFVYVDDVYQVVKRAVAENKNTLINLGTGHSVSVKNIADMIFDLLSVSAKIEYKEVDNNRQRRVKNLQFNCARIKKEFPHLTMTKLQAGVADYIGRMEVNRC